MKEQQAMARDKDSEERQLRLTSTSLCAALYDAEKEHKKLFDIAKSTKYGPECDRIQAALARAVERAEDLESRIHRESRESYRNPDDVFVHRNKRQR